MRRFKRQQSGFTLLEVLITVFILAVGLLGLAALQLNSLAYNQSAYYRSQAVLQAYDIIDRMRANRPAAFADDYVLTLGDAAPTIGDSSTIADRDMAQWLSSLSTILPSGDGSIACDAGSSDCSVGIVVTVQWDDRRAEDGTSSVTQQVQATVQL